MCAMLFSRRRTCQGGAVSNYRGGNLMGWANPKHPGPLTSLNMRGTEAIAQQVTTPTTTHGCLAARLFFRFHVVPGAALLGSMTEGGSLHGGGGGRVSEATRHALSLSLYRVAVR
jgi:hypothetical protein